MRDGQDANDFGSVVVDSDDRQHEAWPVFVALFPALDLEMAPKVGIAKNEADFRLGRKHRFLELVIQVIVARLHFRRLDRRDFALAQFAR